jgi:plasmid stabilization system protein ParE
LGKAVIAYTVEDRDVIVVRVRYGGRQLLPNDLLE